MNFLDFCIMRPEVIPAKAKTPIVSKKNRKVELLFNKIEKKKQKYLAKSSLKNQPIDIEK